jgi:hypothetical protein
MNPYPFNTNRSYHGLTRIPIKIALILSAILLTTSLQAQTFNFIATGDMESAGWTGIAGNTNMNVSFELYSGSLKTTINQ